MGFFELNIATSGLFAAQRGLQVTSNNISNANTTGYSRQVLSQKASTPLGGIGVGMTGTGVTTTNIGRVRDSYIDQKLWTQNPRLGEYTVKVAQNSIIESTFGEPSDSGFTAVFNDLFTGMSQLSTDPSSEAYKTELKEQMVGFTKYFNTIAATLKNNQQDLNFDLKNTVDEINNLATHIQSLNKQIMEAEIYGDEANTFRDERDNCIDRLSQIIDIKVQETEYKIGDAKVNKLTIKVGGQTLVDHLNCNTLQLKVRGQVEKQIDAQMRDLVEAYKELDQIKNDSDKEEEQKTQIKQMLQKLSQLSEDVTIEKDKEGLATSIQFTCRNGEKVNLFTINSTEVDPEQKYLISSAGDGKLNEEENDGLYDITWSNGTKFDMEDKNMSGELKGLIDMRDGCGTGEKNTYSGIPYYMKRLDEYVRQFTKTMNEGYSKTSDGYIEIKAYKGPSFTDEAKYIKKDSGSDTLNFYNDQKELIATLKKGETPEEYKLLSYNNGTVEDKPIDEATYNKISNAYMTQYALFTYSNEYTEGQSDGIKLPVTTANNFSVSKELLDNPTSMRTLYEKADSSDTSFMLDLLRQKDNKDMFREGDPKDYMTAIFSELGISANQAEMYQNTQSSVVRNLTNQRLSVSQVDISEEFTYLIQYQQAYQAAAKVINTMDGIYETTLFKLGNF